MRQVKQNHRLNNLEKSRWWFRLCAVVADVVSVRSLLSVCTCLASVVARNTEKYSEANVKPILQPNRSQSAPISHPYPQTPMWTLSVNKKKEKDCQQQKLAPEQGNVKAKAIRDL